MNKLEKKLQEIINKSDAKSEGIEYLLKYYQKSLHWSKKKAIEYTLKLFEDGTIDSIIVISKKGGNDDAKKR